MIDRACISINNICNLNCSYCHFHTPAKAEYLAERPMEVFAILDNIMSHIEKYDIKVFKLGFVGNGEPLLSFDELNEYIKYIDSFLSNGRIAAYTITNGTLINREMLEFFKAHKVNVGFSLDGIPKIHNKYRSGSHTVVMEAVELFRDVNSFYPSMNCTVSRDVLEYAEETVEFFEKYGSRITFSRMIGEGGISLTEFHKFIDAAKSRLNIRIGGYDCTMYGGKCGAGINNIFYANGKIFLCGNCVDLPLSYDSHTPIDNINFDIGAFDRNNCYKEEFYHEQRDQNE